MTDVVLFDLDGTLADITHRLHFIKSEGKKDWDAFHAACVDDKPIPEMIVVAKALAEVYPLYLVSGRMETVRAETIMWLYNHDIGFTELYMRAERDYRVDHEIKREFLSLIRDMGHNPILVFDDRQQVVNMWRAEGIRCCQVAKGDF